MPLGLLLFFFKTLIKSGHPVINLNDV